MSCMNMTKSACYKSVQTAYNNATQTFTATGGTVAVLGTQICDTGCSIDTGTNGFTIMREGVYRISYDVVFTATGAGIGIVQLYNGTTALPCASAQFTGTAEDVDSIHVETTIPLRSCYGNRPVVSCQVSGVPGSVSHVCASVVRIA